MTAPLYRYLAYDLIANTPVGEFQAQQVTFNTTLNKPGKWEGKVGSMSDPGIKAGQLASLIIPGRTALFVDRNGAIVWGGLIWTATYQRSTDLWDVVAQTFMSYFARRRIRVNKFYTSADQLFVVQDLINYAQSVSGGNIGLNVPSNTSGVLVSPQYSAIDRRVLGDEITTLSQAVNGFDFEVDCSYVAGIPTKNLTLNYPRRGKPAGATGLVFENPGNVTDYSIPNDATPTAFTVDVTGTGSTGTGTTLPVSSSITSYINAGWPLLEDVIPYKGTNDPNLLAAFAQAQVTTLGQPQILPQVIIDPSQDPVLGSYLCGDEARFRLSGPMWGNGVFDTFYRIIDIAVKPQEAGQHETATLTLAPTLGY